MHPFLENVMVVQASRPSQWEYIFDIYSPTALIYTQSDAASRLDSRRLASGRPHRVNTFAILLHNDCRGWSQYNGTLYPE